MTLAELAAVVPPPGDEGYDAFHVIRRLEDAIGSIRPSCLRDAAGQWRDPYLELRLSHADGSDLAIVHGDGYTAVGGGPVDYHHFLSTADLDAVLTGALKGTLRHVARERLGRVVDDFFLADGDATPLGVDRFNAGRLMARLPGRTSCTRISFASAPAFAPAEADP